MNLHQLFLADLGPELQLTAETLRQASFAVRRNRNEWLLQQRTRAVIEMIAHTADQWLEPGNQFRILALRDGPQETGWSPATLARADYGTVVPAVVRNANRWGCQFHPERSAKAGARILQNFLGLPA